MPYGNINEFVQALATALQNHPNAYRNRQGNAIAANANDQDVQNAWRVYQAAAQTNLQSLVLGRWVQNSNEQNPGIDATLQTNFHQMNEVNYGGSVMNSQNWTMLMNDAWVLGGVHSHTDFYLASPRTQQNLVHNQFGLTVTARELIGITTFGYEIIRAHADLGEAARVANANAANGASFDAYLNAIAVSLNNGQLTQQALQQLQAPARDVSNEYA